MRSLLQNKFVVLALVLLAFGAAFQRREVLLSFWAQTVQARGGAGAATSEGAPEDSSFVITTNTPARYLTELSNWRQLLTIPELRRRDPFAAVKQTPTADSVTNNVLELSAISIQPLKSLAVVNQQIVAVGELVQGYVVDRIDRDGVVLRDKNGEEKKLEIQFNIPASSPVAPEILKAGDSKEAPPKPTETSPEKSR